MLNKELLVNGGLVYSEPHVIMTLDRTSDHFLIYWGYTEGADQPGSLNRRPYWIKGNEEKLTFNQLVDYTKDTPAYFGTALNFKNGSSYFKAEDTFKLTRADTKEEIVLLAGDHLLTTFYAQGSTTPFFHDLGQGDTVGLFFDPPPDGYL